LGQADFVGRIVFRKITHAASAWLVVELPPERSASRKTKRATIGEKQIYFRGVENFPTKKFFLPSNRRCLVLPTVACVTKRLSLRQDG
jgi:hypothetical protein